MQKTTGGDAISACDSWKSEGHVGPKVPTIHSIAAEVGSVGAPGVGGALGSPDPSNATMASRLVPREGDVGLGLLAPTAAELLAGAADAESSGHSPTPGK